METFEHLIRIALEEDIGPGDITTDYLVDPGRKGRGTVIAKEPLVICGLHVAKSVFRVLDPHVTLTPQCGEGDDIEPGVAVLTLEGELSSLLKGERTALNFLQRLSGIATHVRRYVSLLKNSKVKLVDTRKTTPGWRVLEKYAVRIGGAMNHRMGLYDGVLIKDNHIAVCGGIARAVSKARKNVSHLVKIEVEVEDYGQLREALDAGADVFMLDNMSVDQIKKAVSIIGGKALVEVSGGVTQEDLKTLGETGVDIISSGALTHAARSVDLSMRITE